MMPILLNLTPILVLTSAQIPCPTVHISQQDSTCHPKSQKNYRNGRYSIYVFYSESLPEALGSEYSGGLSWIVAVEFI